MEKSFNFNNVKKRVFPVTMKNGKKYLVKMPEKETFQKLLDLKKSDESRVMEDLYKSVAAVISNNKQGKKVSPEELRGYSLEEIMEFIKGYVEFVKGTQES